MIKNIKYNRHNKIQVLSFNYLGLLINVSCVVFTVVWALAQCCSAKDIKLNFIIYSLSIS